MNVSMWPSGLRSNTKRNRNPSEAHSQIWWTLSQLAAKTNIFSEDPSYVRGRNSLARCCCLFFKSVVGCAYFFLTSPRFSHIYHTGCGEQGLLTQGRGKVRPCNPCSHGGGGNKALEPWLRKYLAVPISTYISFNMCSCLCVQPNCWWILSD